MLANNEGSNEIPTSNKIFEMWLEKLGERPGVRREDKHDLKPHLSLKRRPEDIKVDREVSRPPNVLTPDLDLEDQTVTIHRLEEIYPTECNN